MKNKAFNAAILTLSSAGFIYGSFSLWAGIDPMPVAIGISIVSVFVFWYVLLWSLEEIKSADNNTANN